MNKKIFLFLILSVISKNLLHEEYNHMGSKKILTKQNEVIDKVIKTNISFDEYVNNLPFKEDMINLSESEIHSTPELVLRSAELIAKIQVDAQKNKKLRIDALSFFKKCVENQRVLSSIRAICLNKLYILIPKWKLAMPLDASHISDEIERLAFHTRF